MADYTDVDDDELADFLCRYDLGQLIAYKGIAEGVENTNYFLETTAGKFILTLYERRVSRHDLPYFLGLPALANIGIRRIAFMTCAGLLTHPSDD